MQVLGRARHCRLPLLSRQAGSDRRQGASGGAFPESRRLTGLRPGGSWQRPARAPRNGVPSRQARSPSERSEGFRWAAAAIRSRGGRPPRRGSVSRCRCGSSPGRPVRVTVTVWPVAAASGTASSGTWERYVRPRAGPVGHRVDVPRAGSAQCLAMAASGSSGRRGKRPGADGCGRDDQRCGRRGGDQRKKVQRMRRSPEARCGDRTRGHRSLPSPEAHRSGRRMASGWARKLRRVAR